MRPYVRLQPRRFVYRSASALLRESIRDGCEQASIGVCRQLDPDLRLCHTDSVVVRSVSSYSCGLYTTVWSSFCQCLPVGLTSESKWELYVKTTSVIIFAWRIDARVAWSEQCGNSIFKSRKSNCSEIWIELKPKNRTIFGENRYRSIEFSRLS